MALNVSSLLAVNIPVNVQTYSRGSRSQRLLQLLQFGEHRPFWSMLLDQVPEFLAVNKPRNLIKVARVQRCGRALEILAVDLSRKLVYIRRTLHGSDCRVR